ncbi:MAG: hypothetical protein ABI622_05020 [Chloroflexota bacterium]
MATRSHRPRDARLVGAVLALLLVAVPVAVSGKQFTAWGAATAEVGINSPQADGCPIESPNGLQLFIASARPGAVGGAGDPNDIWYAERAAVDAPWGEPAHLPAPVNSAAADFCPTPLNGNGLLFVSTRGGPGSCGAGDMYFTRRNPAHGWSQPVNLGCAATGAGPNFPGGEFSPSLVETDAGTFLYFSSTGFDGGDQDIYVSAMRADGTFAPATAVTELNTAANDQMPNVSRDGREIVFANDGGGNFDIYTSIRASTDEAWSSPWNLGASVNTGAPETRPSLSGDGERLHFGRSGDIYVSSRSRATGN